MGGVATPEVYLYVRSAFSTVYLLWAGLWALVAWHYGQASYGSWLAAGGRWRNAPSDILAPFWWAIRESLCVLGVRRPGFCGETVPTRYQIGHMLRFSIFLGSLTPILFGLQFFDLDRRSWGWVYIVLTFVFAGSSILAAGGHLFLAYRSRPAAWRKVVMRSLAWILLSPVAFYYAYSSGVHAPSPTAAAAPLLP